MNLGSATSRTLLAAAPLVLGVALSMIWVLLAGRIDPALLANLATAQASALLMALLGRVGVENRLLRSAVSSEHGVPMLMKHALLGTIVLSWLVSCALLVARFGFGLDGYPWTPLTVGALTAPAVTAIVLSVELLKVETRPVVASTLNSVAVPSVITIGCLLLAAGDYGIGQAAGSPIRLAQLFLIPAAYLFASVIGVLAVGGLPSMSGEVSLRGARIYATSTSPFLVTTLVNQLYAGSIVALSSLFLIEPDIAALTIALRVSAIPSLALLVVGYVHSPRLMRTDLDTQAAYGSAAKAAALLGVPVALGVAVLFYTSRAFFPEGLPSPVLVTVLLAGQVVAVCFGPVGLTLVAVGAELSLAALSTGSLVLLLALTSLGAVIYGPVGVAVAVSLSLAAQNTGAYFLYRKRVTTHAAI